MTIHYIPLPQDGFRLPIYLDSFVFSFFFRAQPFEENSRKDQDCLAEKGTPENASYREKASEKGARPPIGLINRAPRAAVCFKKNKMHDSAARLLFAPQGASAQLVGSQQPTTNA